ncbi:MAG: hypothetical protein AAGC81_07640 [Pseudomonadota bacterium]
MDIQSSVMLRRSIAMRFPPLKRVLGFYLAEVASAEWKIAANLVLQSNTIAWNPGWWFAIHDHYAT